MVDDHEVHGVQVTYGDAGEAVFVEVAAPADPTILDVHLVGRLAVDAFADLRSVGVALVEDEMGATAPGWRVGLYVPDDRIEAVSFERGAESAS